MTFEDWKQATLEAIRDKMYDAGFIPDYTMQHVFFLGELVDAAYQYGRKEAEDGREDYDARH